MNIASKLAWSGHFCQTLVVIAFGFCSAQIRAASFELTGRTVVPLNFPVGKTKVGGLSGISFDPSTHTFWSVSDDSSYKGGPPRIYQLQITADGTKVSFLRALPLRDENGKLFPVADTEGIACTGKGAVWVSSEGKGSAIEWVRLFDLKSGRTLRKLPLPDCYLPADASGKPVKIGDVAQARGVVGNRSLESCALSPDRRTVYTANEASLVQDKVSGESDAGGAGLFNPTRIRISALDARTGRCLTQKLYVTEDGCLFGSVSEMLCPNGRGTLWVLERQVTSPFEGPGCCTILIYEVDLNERGATDLRHVPAISTDAGQGSITALSKKLIFDSNKVALNDVDNVEGMCLVDTKEGGRTLVLVSDNNFNPKQQTQILSFKYVP